MKLFQNILTESKREDAELASMLEKLDQNDFLVSYPLAEIVRDVKSLGLRHDRNVAYMRCWRWNIVNNVIDRVSADDVKLKKYLTDIHQKDKDFRVITMRVMSHYRDMYDKCAALKNYSWSGKKPSQILEDLAEIEKRWIETRQGTIPIDDIDKPFIQFPDGYAWVFLDRGGCKVEGDAMGHCGNGAGYDAEAIYSLRQRVKVDGEFLWKPCLTFIVHDDGRKKHLGEMKGRGNTKPSPKYHDKIVALLKSDYVDAIRGGGYLPENNFSIMDLPTETRKSLLGKIDLWGPKALREDQLDVYYSDDRTIIADGGDELYAAKAIDRELGVYLLGKNLTNEGNLLEARAMDELTDISIPYVLRSHHVSRCPYGILSMVNYETQKELATSKPELWDQFASVQTRYDDYDFDYPSLNPHRLSSNYHSIFYNKDDRMMVKIIDDDNELLVFERLAGDIYAQVAYATERSFTLTKGFTSAFINNEEYEQAMKETKVTIPPAYLNDDVIAGIINEEGDGSTMEPIVYTLDSIPEQKVVHRTGDTYWIVNKDGITTFYRYVKSPKYDFIKADGLSVIHNFGSYLSVRGSDVDAVIDLLENYRIDVVDRYAVYCHDSREMAQALVDYYQSKGITVKATR